ncbi:MAG: response regulator [Pseudomonadota bacterium]
MWSELSAALPLPLLQLQPDGTVEQANAAAAEFLGADLATLPGQALDTWLTRLGRMVLHTHLLPGIRTDGAVRDLSLPMRLAGGREVVAQAHAGRSPLRQGDGPIWLALAPPRDGHAVDAELLRVRHAADASPAALFEYVVDAQGRGRFSYASAALLNLFGLTPEQVADSDQALLARLHPDDLPGWLAARQQAAAAGQLWAHGCRASALAPVPQMVFGWRALPRGGPDGSTLWHGYVSDFTGIARERIEREQRAASAEAARREIEELAHDLLDALPTQLVYWDRGQRLRWANKAYLLARDLQRDAATGQPRDALRAAQEPDWPDPGLALAGATVEAELPCTAADGSLHHQWVHSAPRLRQGEVDGCLQVATDISEVVAARQRAESLGAALGEAERFLRLMADSLPARVAYWDRTLVCRFANVHFCQWLGLPPEQVVGASSRQALGEAREQAMWPQITGALAGQAQTFERDERNADGSIGARLVYFFPDQRDGQVHGFVVLGTDVSALKDAQRQLSALNGQLSLALDRAEASARAKSAFLANMSHEIRTPMNAIIGLAHLLSRDSQDTLQRERLGKIDAACQLLLNIVNDVLDLSKIEAGAMHIEDVEFSVDELLSRVVDLVGQRARDKGLELVLDTDGVASRLRGDPTRLTQALVNLMANAVKFTTRGWVRLRMELMAADGAHQLVRFAVTDTGEGIEATQRERLFEAFEQADASTTRRYGGTGLGLAITRHLARLMGGTIGVDSTPGQGSTFWFTARLGRAAEAGSTAAAPSFQGLRALLVDDLPESIGPLQERLRSFGLEVVSLASGQAAIDHLAQQARQGESVDILFIDWRMEPLDGAQTLQRLRALMGDGLPPAVLMTAFDEAQMWREAKAAAFEAVLVKPVTASALHDTLARVLRRQPLPPGAMADPQRDEQALRRHHGGQQILLVEDNPINQEIAVELLQRVGLRVDTATDGERAVQLATTRHYDLVLMDVQMPGMDGLAATRAIRRQRGGALPIVAMTANAFAEDRAEALLAGMNDHLAKPVDPGRLHATLLRWLPRRAPADAPAQAGTSPAPTLRARLQAVADLDLDTALRSTGGDEAMLERVLGRFTLLYGQGCAPLLQAGQAQQRQQMAAAAHSLRGACASVGALAMAADLEVLERMARAGLAPAADLEAIGARVEGRLRDLVAALAAQQISG